MSALRTTAPAFPSDPRSFPLSRKVIPPAFPRLTRKLSLAFQVRTAFGPNKYSFGGPSSITKRTHTSWDVLPSRIRLSPRVLEVVEGTLLAPILLERSDEARSFSFRTCSNGVSETCSFQQFRVTIATRTATAIRRISAAMGNHFFFES